MSPWLLLAASYLLGAVPASYVAGRWARGIDLREHGSGNLGATNTFRVLGAKVAAPVMLFDVLKGFVPAFLFPKWVPWGQALHWALAFGVAAIVGHVFSVYVGFRGGKGVATGAGVFLGLAPLGLAVAFVVWIVVLRAGRMVSLASLLAALTLVAVLWIRAYPLEVRLLGTAVAAFIVFAHRANIGRLARGQEPKFGSGPKAAEAAAEEAAS